MARPTDWIDTRISIAPNSGGQANTSLVSGFTGIDLRGVTVVRTIIRLSLFSTTVAGAWGVQTVDLAMGIVSRESFTASVLPDPSSDSEKPPLGWMWRTRVAVSQNGVGSSVLSEVVADIRAARMIQNGEVFLVADNTAARGTAFAVDVRGLVRLLTKLP